jgi:iron complex transport system substrate-binding protein
VWADVRRVGGALGRAERGDAVAARLAQRVAELGAVAARIGRRPRVLTIEWLDPVMVGGTWMPELVELAGGTPLVTEPGQHAPTLGPDELAALDPEVVLIKPCGYDLARTRAELALIPTHLPLERWPAARVFVADGNAYFNRPGPRLVESLEILAACVHPQAFGGLARRHATALRRLGAGPALLPVV